MKSNSFVYHSPKSLSEALSLLNRHKNDDARVLAGGQSLVPVMAFRLAMPKYLIDINGIDELRQLRCVDGHLLIGAGIRHADFEKPVVEGSFGSLLSCIAKHIAHYPIRTRGTFCGSLAHADPASEWCLAAVTLDASITAISVSRRRLISADRFFLGPLTTILTDEEILTEVAFPLPPPDAKLGFFEFSRRAGDYAIGMALTKWILKNGHMTDVRIGIGGIESNPRRISEAERILEDKAPSSELFKAAADAVGAYVEPLEDLQADAAYRVDIARAVTKRALEVCQRS